MCVTTDLAEKHLKNNYSIEVIRADLIKTIAIVKALEEQLRLNGVVASACDEYIDGINMDCANCGEPKYTHRH